MTSRLLRRNTHNRNVRASVIEDYVRDIQAKCGAVTSR
jgi:hypothetical protein